MRPHFAVLKTVIVLGGGFFALGGAQVGVPFRAIATLGFTFHDHALAFFGAATVVFRAWGGLSNGFAFGKNPARVVFYFVAFTDVISVYVASTVSLIPNGLAACHLLLCLLAVFSTLFEAELSGCSGFAVEIVEFDHASVLILPVCLHAESSLYGANFDDRLLRGLLAFPGISNFHFGTSREATIREVSEGLAVRCAYGYKELGTFAYGLFRRCLSAR